MAWILLAGCGQDMPAPPPSASEAPTAKPPTLVEARQGHRTEPSAQQSKAGPVPVPPAEVFRLVRYDTPAGKLAAYLSPDPGDGKKYPAIVWITGGDCNSIGEVWEDAPKENDQTAAAYRKAGIVMMFPSLRGGNDNPGLREGFFGEVDDVIAAAEHLAHEPYVDASRIYLGGHSTGGTLAMLVAESSERFRAVFAFGPVPDVGGYEPVYLPFNASDRKEISLRSPSHWLNSVRRPLFVIEGTEPPSNISAIQLMRRISTNPLIHFVSVDNTSHFSVLAPVNEVLASKILRDEGPDSKFSLTEADLPTIQP